MPIYKKRSSFTDDTEMVEVQDMLSTMVGNSGYNTKPSFSADILRYPDNQIPFIDKHMSYLMTHKGINAQHYIANLKLMTRIR